MFLYTFYSYVKQKYYSLRGLIGELLNFPVTVVMHMHNSFIRLLIIRETEGLFIFCILLSTLPSALKIADI